MQPEGGGSHTAAPRAAPACVCGDAGSLQLIAHRKRATGHGERSTSGPQSPHSACMQQNSAAYVLKRDSANDITITQMFITLAIMLEVY